MSSQWPQWSRLRGPMIIAQSWLGEVTAESRRGHSWVTARSQLSHGEVTAQSRHLQYDHSSVTARSQLNHGPGHSSTTAQVTAGCDHFGHGELTVSSPWWSSKARKNRKKGIMTYNKYILYMKQTCHKPRENGSSTGFAQHHKNTDRETRLYSGDPL